nr:ubiquitin hydrolase [Tanacetum cinerariifolium]
MYRESNLKCIKTLEKELETLKEEKDVVDGKLARLLKSSKDLESIIESQRSNKIKDGVGYNVVPPPAADLYLSPKKDLSWTGLLEFANDTVNDYSRPLPTVESTSEDGQNRNSSTFENEKPTDSILSKPAVKFVKAVDRPAERPTTNKAENVKKPTVKYAEMYRRPSMKPTVRGNQRNWNNLKTQKLGLDFAMMKKACYNCGDFNHFAYDCRKKVRDQYRASWVPTVNMNFPLLIENFPLVTQMFPLFVAAAQDIIGSSITTQQTKLYLELVPKEKRIENGKCNERLNPGKKQREPTFQLIIDALALTPCYFAFLTTADVPEVYMHQFQDSIHKDKDDSNNDHDSSSEGDDQESDSGDDITQSDKENGLESEHENDENETGSKSDQEENKEEVEDDEEEKDDEFVKTSSNSTHDEDETNEESKVEDKAEVNTNEWFIQKEDTDAEMINVQQGNENLEITLNQVIEDEELEFEVVDSDMPQDHEENMGNNDEEPKKNVTSKRDCTPIDFSVYIMNVLKITNLTQETLLGPSFKILKGTRTNFVELKYDFEECYKALSEKLDWDNPEGDELYKFSDGTLTGLRTSLDDITKNIQMEYLPQRRWSSLEKKRAHIMIKAIDKQLKERRMMRSFEMFVRERHYETELWLLQRTI